MTRNFHCGLDTPLLEACRQQKPCCRHRCNEFLGFPSNIVVVREVSEVVGETEDEKLRLNSKLSVSYVVGGITVVTILSVVMASIISRYLF